MPTPQNLALFALASVLLALTPGPNLLGLASRTLCQGRRAGIVSLAGTSLGFGFHVFAAARGLSSRGRVPPQRLVLGLLQTAIGTASDLVFVLAAGAIAGRLARRPPWTAVQRWVLGVVLTGIAVRLAFDSRR